MVNVGGVPGRPIRQRRMTNAEKQARWRLRHDRARCSPDSPPGSGAHLNLISPEMIVNCVPRGNVDLDELVGSGHRSMDLYNKMIGRIERWLDQLDDGAVTPADIFKAYHLLAPTLDSLVTLQAKIAQQRVTEARGVTPQREAQPKIGETARDLLRSRLNGNIKPKAT
jgi:hypothetical protein